MSLLYRIVRYLFGKLPASERVIIYQIYQSKEDVFKWKKERDLKKTACEEMQYFLESKGEDFVESIAQIDLRNPVPLPYSGITPPAMNPDVFWGKKKGAPQFVYEETEREKINLDRF